MQYFDGLGRGNRKDIVPVIPPLSAVFADQVCSRHNQDVRFLLVGRTGSGKSRSLLYLAWKTAQAIAKRKGGKWQDYFSMDNLIIGDAMGHLDLFQGMKKRNVYIFDDCGVALDSRAFATNFNRSVNHIFEVSRTDNCVLLFSAPDSFLVDKVIRTLMPWTGEISESYHSSGFNLCKIFSNERKFRMGKTFTRYPRYGNCAVVRYIFKSPPDELVNEYELRRSAATKSVKDMAGKEKEKPHKVEFPDKTCNRCGYTWTPRKGQQKKCPSCNQPLIKVSSSTTAT